MVLIRVVAGLFDLSFSLSCQNFCLVLNLTSQRFRFIGQTGHGVGNVVVVLIQGVAGLFNLGFSLFLQVFSCILYLIDDFL